MKNPANHVNFKRGIMNGFWCYYLKRWSPQFCSDLIERAKKYDFVHGVVGDQVEGVMDDQIRRSRVKFLQSTDPLFADVFNDLWLMAIEANKTFFNFHISKLDYVQLGEYVADNKGEYKKHYDVFWLNDDPHYHRKLSCVVQLTDPNFYKGGDLVIEDIHHEVPKPEDIRQQGTVTFFPSFVFHKVTPVTQGTRYSLVAWFDGPKWR